MVRVTNDSSAWRLPRIINERQLCLQNAADHGESNERQLCFEDDAPVRDRGFVLRRLYSKINCTYVEPDLALLSLLLYH